MHCFFVLLVFCIFPLLGVDSWNQDTVNIVPLPRKYHRKESERDFLVVLKSKNFEIVQTGSTVYEELSELIESQYRGLMFTREGEEVKEVLECGDSVNKKCVGGLEIKVRRNWTSNPSLEMMESYELDLESVCRIGGEEVFKIVLSCEEVFGCYRGIETVSQMISVEGEGEKYFVVENYFPIADYPRFSHRGLMIDTSRHFQPVKKILKIIDSLLYLKLNVLHWHIVDAQSFPLVVKKYPRLSGDGAYAKEATYSKSDLEKVYEYARVRGIRVIVEVDIPGHSGSWHGYPVIAACSPQTNVNNYVLSPIVDMTYQIIEEVIAELVDVFKEKYLHLGGDEVYYSCWDQDANIKKWMEDKSMDNYDQLLAYFDTKVHDIYTKFEKTLICWEEMFLSNLSQYYQLPMDTIVQVWKTADREEHLHEVISTGKRRAILSGGWYLNNYHYNVWQDYYLVEPFSGFPYTEEEKQRLVGVEACAWSEHIDPANFDAQVYPALILASERFWSDQSVVDVDDARERVNNYRCEFVRRGINSEPLAPGYCKYSNDVM